MPYCYLNVIADVNNLYHPTPILLSGDFINLKCLMKSMSSTFISEFEKTQRPMYLFVAPLAQVINLFEEAGFTIFNINKSEKRNIWILHKGDKQKSNFSWDKQVDIALSTDDLVKEDGRFEDCPKCKMVFVRNQGDNKNKVLPYRSVPTVLCSNQSQQIDQNDSFEENEYITKKILDQDSEVNGSDTEALPTILNMMNLDENKYPENYQINYLEAVPNHNENIIFIPSTNLLNQCAVVGISRDQENSSASTGEGESYEPIPVEEKPIIGLSGKPSKRFLNKKTCVRESSIDNNLIRMIIEKNNLPTNRSNTLFTENNIQREEKNPRLKIQSSSESIKINNQPKSPGVGPKYFESSNSGSPKKVNNEELTKCLNEILSRNEEASELSKDNQQIRIKNKNIFPTTETDTQTESYQCEGELKCRNYALVDRSAGVEYESETQYTIRDANEIFTQNFSQKESPNETNKLNNESDIDLEAYQIIKKYQDKYTNNECNIDYASPSQESSYSFFDTRSHGSLNSLKDGVIKENDMCEAPPFKDPVQICYETIELASGEAETLPRNYIIKVDKQPKYNIKEINEDNNSSTCRLIAPNKTFKNAINDKNKANIKNASIEDKNYLPLSPKRQTINAITNQSFRKEFINKKCNNNLIYESSFSKGVRLDQNNDVKSPSNTKFGMPYIKDKTKSLTFSRMHTKNFF